MSIEDLEAAISRLSAEEFAHAGGNANFLETDFSDSIS
jgi:hypothetical protein